MQKATFAITVPHIISRLYLRSLRKPNHTSTTSRFCVHETFQLNQSNLFLSNPAFVRVYRE
jgi:hypothetical protein